MDLITAVAPSPACSITDSSAGCYTASWYLIWDQIQYWLIIQVPIIVLSIIYEYIELPSLKYVERLRQICDSPLINVVNYLIQIVTSLYVCINWIVRGGSLSVIFSSWSIESLFLIATAVGYALRWLAAKNKVTFVLQLHHLFDLLSVVAHFAMSSQTIIIGTKRLRSWLDFGFVRSYVGYVVVDHLFTRYQNKTFFTQVLLVVFKALCLVFFFASVLFSLERLGELPHTNSFLLHVYECSNENGTETVLKATNEGTTEHPNCDETWSFFSSIYFMFVTVSTVGYGDFSPRTVLGQLTVCVIIVFGIYTFANESAALMTIYGDQRGAQLKYDGSRNTAHVIVTGNPSVAQIKDFIREFFHPDHREAFQSHDSDYEVSEDEELQMMSSQKASRSLLSSKRFSNIRIRNGSNHEVYTAMEEGQRSGEKKKRLNIKSLLSKWANRRENFIRETHIVILMQFDNTGENASYQRQVMEFVAQNPRYVKRVFLVYGSPLRDADLRNAQLDRAMAVFFLPNKYSDDSNREDAATVLRVLSVSQRKSDRAQLFAMLANSDNRILLEATGIGKNNLVCADEIRLGLMGLSCRCPGLSTVVSNLITSRSGVIPEIGSQQAKFFEPWISEYISGAANEIYSCCLAPHFYGMNFIQAVMHIHRQSNGLVLFIAVESDGEIAFNPGRWYCITSSTRAYMIAESVSSLKPFAGQLTMSAIATLCTDKSLLHNRENLLSRARQAQHNVERRIPTGVRDHIMQCATNNEPPTSPSPELLSAGKHIVVCSNIGNESGGQRSISRLVNFLRPLRAPHIERMVPVVIVDAGTFDSVSWLQVRDFGEVYHVHGSPQSHQALVRAGIYTASSIVVLAQGNEAGYDDSKAIFNAILVNSALQRSKIFTIIELRDVNNNRFLDSVSSFRSLHNFDGQDFKNWMDSEYDVKSYASNYREALSSGVRESAQFGRASSIAKKRSWWQRQTRVIKRASSAVSMFFLGSLKNAAQHLGSYRDDTDSGEAMIIESLYQGNDSSTFFQERFMNGSLFPSSVADDLLIQSFFNPSLNSFICKILDGKSCFVLYDIPKKLRGRELLYRELFEYMTSSIAHTLPIGLLRAQESPGGAPYPYVYTCPSSDTIVYPRDKIFVLVNIVALNHVANKLQQNFRNRLKPSTAVADLVGTH
ncbi:voltage-gated ion channel superfamily [Plasmopara halstedii]|uniref:Voltage-gated ion channel superfamily n=1 Tax=Plasmopara halstedii TaxID=4781 RepID=A0A0P1AD09_PLAHL|nr:voltage-gated ion channel superfamily [Plasmopara halstedii]CEG38348.1 voltage-gated ion channel superfamily [Plasmopara halstedii]|eukprot:XP_024574717.1 voltage-gated ion channel superfamily [Plasmopara halstedii]